MSPTTLKVLLGILEAVAVGWLVVASIATAKRLIDPIAAFLDTTASDPDRSADARPDDFEFAETSGRSWHRGSPRHDFRFELPQETPHGRIHH